MDISIHLHGPLAATVGQTGDNNWVTIKKADADEYGDLTLFVNNAESAVGIAAAVNAAFPAAPKAEPLVAGLDCSDDNPF